jgi:ceramidase
VLSFVCLRLAFIVGLAAVALAALLILPPIHQDPRYHAFADQRTIWGIPNFWNVVSNLPFFLVAIWGIRALRNREAFLQPWERSAYLILLLGVGLVAFGSSYYHAWPDNTTLFWDRLPMAIVFMSLLATTIGERISMRGGRLLLLPLIAIGAASVIAWRLSGDLRLYGVVQFYPMLALPLLLILFPSRYSAPAGVWAMIAFYALAKILEYFDHQIAPVLSTGGHPWKHLAGGAAMLCYVSAISGRRALTDAPVS